MLKCIAAVDADFGIGYQNQLLERIPEDMDFFKALTIGHPVVMGRKTFDSLPTGKLLFRTNIVLTRSNAFNNNCPDYVYPDIEGIIAYSKLIHKDVFVIGGASIYKELLPYCDVLYLTHIYKKHNNIDAYFPSIDDWRCCASSSMHYYNNIPYQFKTYIKSDF